MTWTSIFIAGLITYFTRMSMVTLIDKDIFSENFRKILNYVPSVVFPSIIFPGILLDDYGTLVDITDPKIYGALTAIIIGYFSRNVILTIISGLASYWFLIFVF
ncbi:AzlD domain-containing protein [Candidatus Pelagibacter sp.]|nr:AzlD domain-containing protein [Candidatus Pelagibacter sp.]